MKLVISIELGNDAMQDGYDAYQAIAQSGISRNRGEAADGIFRDANGNTVGTWEIIDEEAFDLKLSEAATYGAEVEANLAGIDPNSVEGTFGQIAAYRALQNYTNVEA